jgi:hypothetical protein
MRSLGSVGLQEFTAPNAAAVVRSSEVGEYGSTGTELLIVDPSPICAIRQAGSKPLIETPPQGKPFMNPCPVRGDLLTNPRRAIDLLQK